jgi:hypothetical protein
MSSALALGAIDRYRITDAAPAGSEKRGHSSGILDRVDEDVSEN